MLGGVLIRETWLGRGTKKSPMVRTGVGWCASAMVGGPQGS